MKQTAHKTLLDSLLDSTQQNLFSKSFAFDWARIAGNNSRIKGNFDNGREYIGTNQNDTVVITGNVIGGDENTTSIDLLDGNDTLTVRGKLIAKEGQYVSITGGEGDKTINLNGGVVFTSTPTERYRDTPINISLSGEGKHTINVKGDIVSNGPTTDTPSKYDTTLLFNIENGSETANTKGIIDINGRIIATGKGDIDLSISNYYNYLTIYKDIILRDGSNLSVDMNGHETAFKVKGNYIVDDASTSFFGTGNYDDSSTLLTDISGLTQVTNGTISWMFDDGDYSTFKFNDISLINGLISIEFIGTSSDLSINGDVKIDKGGYFDTVFITDKISTVEIDGQFILQGSTADHQSSSRIWTENGDDLITLLGGVSNDSSSFVLDTADGNDDVYVGKSIAASDTLNITALNKFDLSWGDDTFTLVGNMSAKGNSENIIDAGKGNDKISITGDISVSNGGTNSILAGASDDIITLKGHIGADALYIDGGEGNDTLVLSAVTQKLFEADYKEWLTDLSSTGSLSKCNIETIRLDVRGLHIEKLGWFTDIVNKANTDGAHIAVEDKAGHQLVNPSAYLAQNNDTHNPINDVLDHYAPAAANAAQPKAFAENVATPSGDAFAAPHFDNNSFLHEMEQQAQAHAAAAA